MNSPQQTAEELAEKLIKTLPMCCVCPACVKRDIKIVLAELNLASLLTNKEKVAKLEAELQFERNANYYNDYAKAKVENAELLKDKEKIALRMSKQINKLLAHCGDTECSECAKIICPFKEELHFHHDGCPSCCNVPSGMICPDHETDKMIESAITAAMNQPK